MESSWVGDVVASQSSSPTMVSLVGEYDPHTCTIDLRQRLSSLVNHHLGH